MTSFDALESLLSQLLSTGSPTMSAEERVEVQRFIDVGEYGLALETFVAIYVDEQRTPSPIVVDLVTQLASMMSMDVGRLLDRVPK